MSHIISKASGAWAVSYTHLDVYNRQVVQISAKGLQLVAFLVVMAELEETEVPGLHVCKRHLPVQVVSEGVGGQDVYKRQIKGPP